MPAYEPDTVLGGFNEEFSLYYSCPLRYPIEDAR